MLLAASVWLLAPRVGGGPKQSPNCCGCQSARATLPCNPAVALSFGLGAVVPRQAAWRPRHSRLCRSCTAALGFNFLTMPPLELIKAHAAAQGALHFQLGLARLSDSVKAKPDHTGHTLQKQPAAH